MTYIVMSKTRSVMNLDDGAVRDQCEPTVERHTAAGLLRWALDNRVLAHRTGGIPYPEQFDECHLGYRDHDKGRDYHLIDTFAKYEITGDHLTAMRRAQARYKEILHYFREVEPEWREAKRTSHPDSSVEVTEIDKRGNLRTRMAEPPSGDACF